MKNIASIVNGDQTAIEKAHAEGIHVGAERFVVARIDDGNIYGRKVRSRPPYQIPPIGATSAWQNTDQE
jgi:hypothetical protein